MRFIFLFILYLKLFCVNGQSIEKTNLFAPQNSISLIGIPEKTKNQLKEIIFEESLTTNTELKTANVIPIGISGSIFTNFYNYTNSLSYLPELNLITFCYRDTIFYESYGSLALDYSVDGGSTWEKNISLTPAFASGAYTGFLAGNFSPSIVAINRPGNLDPDSAILAFIASLPEIDLNVSYYILNGQADGTGNNQLEEYIESGDTITSFHHAGLSAINDSSIGAVAPIFIRNEIYSYDTISYNKLIFRKGIFDTELNIFNWEFDTLNLNLFEHDMYPIAVNDLFGGWCWDVAFSPDGNIGYCMMVGAEKDDSIIYPHPILFKTIDGGINWSKLPTYQFLENDTIIKSIQYSYTGENIPFFNQIDIAVDHLGRLHLFGDVYSKFYNSVNSDSIFKLYSQEEDGIFKEATLMLHMITEDGIQFSINVIDSFWLGKYYHETPYYDILVGYCPQISRTEDGKYLFMGWIKTKGSSAVENDEPNFYAVGYSVDSNKFTPKTLFTEFTSLEDKTCFLKFAPLSIVNGDEKDFEIPVVANNLEEIGDEYIQIYYLKNVGFDSISFGGPPFPIADFYIDEVNMNMCQEVEFFNTSLYADNYFWDFGDGTTTTLENPIHSFPLDFMYQVMLIASNSTGSDTTLLTIIWSNIESDFSTNNISVYPNPAGKFLRINAPQNTKKLNFYISDMLGNLFYEDEFQNNTNEIDIEFLQTGIYFISFFSEQIPISTIIFEKID